MHSLCDFGSYPGQEERYRWSTHIVLGRCICHSSFTLLGSGCWHAHWQIFTHSFSIWISVCLCICGADLKQKDFTSWCWVAVARVVYGTVSSLTGVSKPFSFHLILWNLILTDALFSFEEKQMVAAGGRWQVENITNRGWQFFRNLLGHGIPVRSPRGRKQWHFSCDMKKIISGRWQSSNGDNKSVYAVLLLIIWNIIIVILRHDEVWCEENVRQVVFDFDSCKILFSSYCIFYLFLNCTFYNIKKSMHSSLLLGENTVRIPPCICTCLDLLWHK